MGNTLIMYSHNDQGFFSGGGGGGGGGGEGGKEGMYDQFNYYW